MTNIISREVIDLSGSDDIDGAIEISQYTGKRHLESDDSNTNEKTRKKPYYDDGSQPVVFMTDSGSIGVTEGLLPLLNILDLRHTRTCSRAQNKSNDPPYLLLLHIQQNDKWSCGYRNLQMMLSALLPRFPAHHPYFRGLPESLRPSKTERPLPSLTDVQGFLEQAWQLGFDERGAAFYSGKVIGKVEWIGALEVWSILASRSIDAVVVQFMKCLESRKKLGDFVWCYFSKTGYCCVCVQENCRQCVQRLLRLGAGRTEERKFCLCSVPPLYLQWEGHSVTVVGVRDQLDGSYDLILFDPARAGGALRLGLDEVLENPCISLPATLIKNTNTLLSIDVQILMSSFRDAMDCSDQKIQLNVVTAPSDSIRVNNL